MSVTVTLELANGKESEYRVVRYRHGMATFGPVPVSEICRLMQDWSRRGYTWVDATIAEKLGASLVCGNKADLNEWRKELGLLTSDQETEADPKAEAAK